MLHILPQDRALFSDLTTCRKKKEYFDAKIILHYISAPSRRQRKQSIPHLSYLQRRSGRCWSMMNIRVVILVLCPVLLRFAPSPSPSPSTARAH